MFRDIVIGADRVVVTGTNRSDGSVDAAAVVNAIADRVDLGNGGSLEPVYPAGRVNSTAADGDEYYVAMGDSLAANVGVEEPRDGYVSRFHGWLEQDGVELGLRNFGIPGETSGSLLYAGQLDDAIEFGKANFVRYVTIDIGANDLLGHLSSPDCSEDLTNRACEDRIEATLEAYETNIAEVFRLSARAFPDARIVFLTAYNPFGFGFEDRVEFEAMSNEILMRLNAIAAEAAEAHGIEVADGFTPDARAGHRGHPDGRLAARHPSQCGGLRPPRRGADRHDRLSFPDPGKMGRCEGSGIQRGGAAGATSCSRSPCSWRSRRSTTLPWHSSPRWCCRSPKSSGPANWRSA